MEIRGEKWELKKVKTEDPIEVSAIFEQVIENEEQTTSVKSKDYEDEVTNLCKRLKMNQRIEDVVIWRHCRK